MSLFALRASRSLSWAIRSGLLLLLASQVFGALMIARGGSTFGVAGAMKVPHALGLHAVQVLPALAWVLSFAPWTETRRTVAVIAGSAGYAVLVGIGAAQVLGGRAPLDLDAGPRALAAAGLLALLGVYAATFAALRRGSARGLD